MGTDVVVVNYRTPADLQRFTESLVRHPPSVPWTFTVINVSPTDSDTTAGLTAVGMATAAASAQLFAFEDNVGYGRACNFAATVHDGDVLAFFNADVLITADVIDECANALRSHSTWGVLGPRQLDENGLVTHAGIFGTHDRPRHRAWQQVDSDAYWGVERAVTVSGAAYFVKRTVWDELTTCPVYQAVANGVEGAFLPTPLFYEETWCSYHAAAHGYEVVYYGKVWLIHNWHRSVVTNGLKKWADAQMVSSKRFFVQACRRHGLVHD